jgi:hypothetical protein
MKNAMNKNKINVDAACLDRADEAAPRPNRKIISIIFVSLYSVVLIAQNPIVVDRYDFDITLKESVVDIQLTIKSQKYQIQTIIL